MITENQITETRIDFSHLLGTWINTYDASKNIGSFKLTAEDNQLIISVNGVDNGVSPGEWGTVICKTLAYSPEKDKAVAFIANYDLNFMNASLSVNTNKGILIIAGSCTFKDGSGRSDYFFREFYFLQ